MNEVEKFIARFHSSDDITEVFTTGCCFWYAKILCERFFEQAARIVYDEIEGHFGAKIGLKVYDITGDVTGKYTWTEWKDVDEARRDKIRRDCVMF